MRLLRPLPAVLLAGCGATTGGPAEDLTWYADIEPIAYEHCVACHHDGGIGPGDWTDPDQVTEWAPAIGAAVGSGRMPLPAADPSCRDYVGSDHAWLPDDDRARIVAWVDQGAPLGKEADRTPGLEVPVRALADTDLSLPVPAPHTLDLDASGNEYHCVVLDNPLTSPRYVTGFDVALDNRSVVHHMLIAIDERGDAGIEYGTDGRQTSFRCQDKVIESDWNILHAWTPGMEPVEFPPGYGIRIDPGDQLVLQMHYFGDPAATDLTDGSGYALRTAPPEEISKEITMIPFGPTGFRIPAGDARYRDEDSIPNPAPFPIEILGGFPHMHLLGSAFRSWLTLPDGSDDVCLLRGDYDFSHQLTYIFREPLVMPPGARAHMRCTWDNSASNPDQFYDPPREITYGEGSNEEMCFLLTYVAY